ncbi:MAG TPA: helix-turn-helix domain-containing protein [Microbacteriaceae bacterium]|nr:helix-turn-helix domain-containing protein [Microbacteriaceae bacterium]
MTDDERSGAGRTGVAVEAAASLRDPARTKLYALIRTRDEAMSRDDAARLTGMPRSTAAFHLDRMVESGLLEVEYRRRSGKGGPGAGRPAKLYRRARQVITLSLPERRYDVVGDVLASAVERVRTTGEGIDASLAEVAREAGARAAAGHTDLLEALRVSGYEPHTEQDGDVVFGNCPFDELAGNHRGLVCGLNLNLVQGMADACGCEGHIEQDPGAGRCCVRAVGLDAAARPAPGRHLAGRDEEERR